MGGRKEGREEGVSWCASVHVCVHVHIIQSVDLSDIPKVSNQFVPCASPIGSTSWKVSDVDMCMCMCMYMWTCVYMRLCASRGAICLEKGAKDKPNHLTTDSLRSVPQESGS